MHKIDHEYLKELTAVISVDCESLSEVVQHATSSTVFKEKINHPKAKAKQTQLSYNCDLLFPERVITLEKKSGEILFKPISHKCLIFHDVSPWQKN